MSEQNEASVQSIVRRPWEFACQWYDVESIHHGINHDKSIVPADVYSREFAEFLAQQYRLAMRKGAELATCEMQDRIDEIEQLVEAVKVLHDLLHKTQVAFVPTTDEAFKLNYEALVKYEWMTKD